MNGMDSQSAQADVSFRAQRAPSLATRAGSRSPMRLRLGAGKTPVG